LTRLDPGNSWAAPVNDPVAKAETPVGITCDHRRGVVPAVGFMAADR
jgi:hypothetical protein